MLFSKQLYYSQTLTSNFVYPPILHRPPPTIRDLIAWVHFMKSVLSVPENHCPVDLDAPGLDVFSACVHGAALVFLDALGSNSEEQVMNGNSPSFG